MRIRSAAAASLGAFTVFAASFGVLELGLRSPSAAERLALRVLALLERTQGHGAILRIDGLRLLASCRSYSGRDLVVLTDGTRFLVVGTHVLQIRSRREPLSEEVSDRRRPFSLRGRAGLVPVEADLAGSHALYARELAGRLEEGDVSARPALLDGRRVYELRLTRRRPVLELMLDRATLRPLAAVYRSSLRTGTSWFLVPRRGRGC